MNCRKTSEKLARQMESVRHKRVMSVKHRIASGRYKISNQTLARALFLAL